VANPYGCEKAGENLQDVHERVSSGLLAISQVAAILQFRLISVISHEWTIATILGSIVGGDVPVRNLRPDNAAITVIVLREDGYSISIFNHSSHLLEQKQFELTQGLSY
jgi:broad specificity phosphatase PhoE